jgi:2'-hydroxyisoflavone reductase
VARILVIGGTRFIGALSVRRLADRHDVVVLSRNAAAIPGASRVVADRLSGIAGFSGDHFDAVLDFLAYDEIGVAAAAALGSTYIAVSSTWVCRLNGSAADARVPADVAPPPSMPAVTQRYLRGKARLEEKVRELRATGLAATVVRLPIVLGDGDHTGRLEFYRGRIADGGPFLLVDGGANVAQILWSEDAAMALAAFVECRGAAERELWEALPDAGRTVADFVLVLSQALGRNVSTISVPAARLRAELPRYLEVEPLWRESPLALTASNVFSALNLRSTTAEEWTLRLAPPRRDSVMNRSDEIALAQRLPCVER